MARKLSDDALLVLSALPKEPLAWPMPDLATDLFGRADSVALSRIRQALDEVQEHLFIESQNTRPFGHKVHYGIRADHWVAVRATLIDAGRLISPG